MTTTYRHSSDRLPLVALWLLTGIVGVLAGWLLLSDVVNWHLLVGGALIVVGIWRVTR